MDFDCQACGACCQASNGYGKHYVRLSAEDMQRLTTSQKRLHTVTIEESYGATGAMSLKGNRKTYAGRLVSKFPAKSMKTDQMCVGAL